MCRDGGLLEGRTDQSATGTGPSARMSTLYSKGLMRVGDSMTHASVIDSRKQRALGRWKRVLREIGCRVRFNLDIWP
ncbi:MAG: proline racemase family protein [Actinomycetota bacterium]